MKEAEVSGPVRQSTSWLQQGMWWAWAMCGDSPTSATRMGEVNLGSCVFKIKIKIKI